MMTIHFVFTVKTDSCAVNICAPYLIDFLIDTDVFSSIPRAKFVRHIQSIDDSLGIMAKPSELNDVIYAI